ncbi:MAG: restriction endonuclease subunit S [Candidatus Schekmanbacteria bacterium]|nr:restriction endonuclease subunit S [Candidatus Schekmanbacteria bacterium]
MTAVRHLDHRGVEWMGDPPVTWPAHPVKRYFDVQLGKMLQNEPASPEDRSVPYLKAIHVQWGRVDTDDLPEMWAGPTDLRQYGIQPGDLLVCEGGEAGRAGVVDVPPPDCIIQNAVHRLRAMDSADVRFLQHVLHAVDTAGWFDVLCNRATIAHFTREKLADLRIPVPNLNEQRAIAAFLDRETARIDALIEKKRRQIELLHEKRAALISHAVTKGLDPNAPMKDSGVAWLGAIPAHWAVIKLRRVTQSRCDGPFGSGLKSEHYVDAGIRVVRLQNIRLAWFDDTDQAFIDPEHYETLGDHDVLPGDLLIAGLGDDNNPVGRACVAPPWLGRTMVKADCFRFRLACETSPEYVALQLSMTASALGGALATGTTRARMNLSETADRVIVLPPFKEQQAIAAILERQSARISAVVAKINLSIDRLREYRTALISAAVTGKLDVRQETVP